MNVTIPDSTSSLDCAHVPPGRRAAAVVLVVMACLLLFLPRTQGATVTWDASGANPTAPTDGAGNWSTTNANWSDGLVDSVWLNGNSAIFGSGGAGGAITVGSGVTVGNLTINTNYTFSANTLTLVSTPTITVAGPATTTTIGSLLAGNGFTKEGPGTLFLNQAANNTYTGDTIINNGMVQPGSTGGRLYVPGNLIVNTNGTFLAVSGNPGSGVFGNGVLVLNGQNPGGSNVFVNSGAWISAGTCVLANGAVITNANGATSGTYAVTNSDARSGAVWLTRHGFGIFNTIAKSTAGTVIISTRPNASASEGYIATLNAGTLMFDYSYTANNAVRLKTGSPLTFAGGLLVFSNSNSTISPSANNPSASGTFFNSGASSLYSTNAGTGGGNLTMGAVTRKTGATFNLVRPGGLGNIGSSTANVNGIVGGWNTYNLTDWTTGTTSWTNLAAASYATSVNPTTWAAVNNVSLNASTSPNVGDGTNINTLRLTSAATVTLDGSLTLASGGLLVTGSGATAITGGTLKGGSGTDLIVHQYASADLTISSTLADNGSATSLTKDGAGKLIITGADTMTGTNYLNGGVVEVSDLAKLASGPLDMNGGTLRYTGSDTTSARAVATRGLGPILDIVGGTTVTQSGAINGSGDILGDLGGLTKIGNGTLILTASNYFNGETVVSGGVLAVNGTNNYNAAVWDAGKVTVFATLGGNGLISGPVTVKNGGTISPGTSIGTLTLAANLSLESGSTSRFEVTNSPGAGDLLEVQGNLTIQPNCTISISILGTPLDLMTNALITYTGTKSGSFNPVVVVNGSVNGSVTIDESTPGQIRLAVIPQVAITSQPVNVVVSTNDNATFTVAATGTAPLTYQWFRYADILGNSPVVQTDATNSSFTITNAQGGDTGFYGVVVTNSFSSVTSQIATLFVGDIAPVIAGPTNKTVIAGNPVTLHTSVVIANPPAALQWLTNGVNVPGATSSSLTLGNVPYALDGAIVSVIATNSAGRATNSATLTVIVTPVITPQPTNLAVNVGDTAVFTSGATGVPTPALQWYRNGIALAGETSGTLTIANAQGSNIGNYTLVATNTAGTVTSASAKLTVVSTNLSAVTLSPANAATGIGYDTPLYVTFNSPVSVRNSGRIRIYNATNSTTPVDTIDMGANSVVISTLNAGLGIFLTNNIQSHGAFQGDTTAFNYFPVITTGSTAAIYPHLGVLTSNQTYYVTMENGVVADAAGAYFAGISDTNAWRFSTKPTGPANPTSLVVAADGSGDFVTVQGAVDSVPAGNTTPRLINVRNGNYVEIVNISGKHNLTLRGQSRAGTIIGYGNNNNLNGGTANRMAFKVNANDVALDNLTVVNTTPQGGSQAETLMVNTAARRCVVNNCDVNSLQDTILVNANSSQLYLYNSTVRGNFDYIWGGGNVFITNCVIRTVPNIYVTNNYNLTASRTDTGNTGNWPAPVGVNQFTSNGISYVSCRLEADPAVNTVTLEGANGTVNGLASWINCSIDTNHYVTPAPAILSSYILWEYGNSNLDNTFPVTMGLAPIGVTNNDPRLLAAQNATVWLNGWTPQLLPNILSQPANQSVVSGATANFTVVATAFSEPSYQWRHYGTNLPGATSATLTINNANANDAGNYSVVVSNSAGSVTSSTVTLTVSGNNAVSLPTIGDYTVNVGVTVNFTNNATDPDVPAQSLTYTLLSAPGNATLGASSGVFAFRPLVTQAGTSNFISLAVADNGSPSSSATQSFSILVNALNPASLGQGSYAGGQFASSVSGDAGPDYAIRATTDFVTWQTIFNTNSPAMPFNWSDTNANLYPFRFYQVILGPPLP